MQARLPYHALAPKSTRALTQFSAVAAASLPLRLRELINLRISQINGCAFCIDMHSAALVQDGMAARHVFAVAGWREAHRFFSEAERAALQWAEAVNAVPQRAPTDDDFRGMKEHFTDAEIAEITFAVGAIRSWNMLNASFQMPVPEEPYLPAH